MTKKLTRSNNKVLAGICAGIAEYMDVDPTLVRVVYAALTVFMAGFPGILLYLVLLLIIPVKPAFEDAEVVEEAPKDAKEKKTKKKES